MPERHVAYVALGANLGDPAAQIEKAMAELARLAATRLLARSGLYASKPAGYADQPDYVNAVAKLATTLTPSDLLARLLDIERRHGRERAFRNAPRTLDLDILLYDDLGVDEPGLRIPHPRMHERAFVLLPLAEIAPDLDLPGHGSIAAALTCVAGDSVHRLAPRG
ncbi:MAG: 2-amino-4-hydroxy-6-hydroxymethyldihydropteridine diphosphokinase [Hydrogenophilales bacterium CG03_land_8_20_14_0_80_62_28]|nr:2-amino-4-hydroxy-6-hydroxymethyldihydropteridine diphosphokinase [Betaproteobacteria bacterium]OIO79319.1 MAG: 2-amino-4-hydroxy-6-hydroxymethyldihydropteridine diphosphokinase [Hydrogenophilaceae bacterium CG1_02_62_390]PIV24243.1 MAG: 2-amino-4-hydroxy-6-hydroxymethyldihydropteridine diphosphokinase [Hydrogenophilales bacterium CG03_land_8_20_14_0_80_62_28]PIW39039.1 MAG: 2-amino-4-hydroxy-6-hydroxymethyldihydropteridine diphosphokinase [Hydrogenophilales bacterium CG15_BIG_FIL_POST_REV_8_